MRGRHLEVLGFLHFPSPAVSESSFGISESREELGLAGSRSFRISVLESRELSSLGISAPRGLGFSTLRNFRGIRVWKSGWFCWVLRISELKFGTKSRLLGISESRTLGVSEI